MSFKIDDSNGFIEQFISNDPYIIDGVKYNYTVQTLYFNGEVSSRQIVYNNNDIKTINEWNKIIDCVNTPVLYSRNSEVVNLESDQTITGNKRFDNGINISGKTIISNDIDNGELKVFNVDDENSYFTIRANEKFDNGIPKIELLGSNNSDIYKYQFPQLENNDTDVVVVKSQFDNLIDIIKENEKVTAVALNRLNEMSKNNGNVTNNLIDITYSEIVLLRDGFGLTPGMQYRIIDYVTTTNQDELENAEYKSAGHRFDIIVTANSENSLNEEARACLNNNTDNYFYDGRSNLDGWKIWYCLDNDIDRFDWADENSGKGVIYRMIDEWGNDCPYDFKNIQFNRNNNYLYTFSFIDENSEVKDVSIFGNNGNLLDAYGYINGVYNNIIGKCVVYNKNNINLKQSLNNIVFLSTYGNLNGSFLGCYSNTFCENCYNNTFGFDCNSNTFGNNCYNNTFGDSCYNNTFGNKCYSNTFENKCYSNTFGNNCYDNILKYSCINNTLGNDCYDNTFENNCILNVLENGCYTNTFGYECKRNYFGLGCNNNTFAEDCNDNIFGNDCDKNKFSYNCDGNTFGSNCSENIFGMYCGDISFGNNCDDNEFLCGHCECISFSNNCKKNKFDFTYDEEQYLYYVRNIHYGNGVSKVKITSLDDGVLDENIIIVYVQNIIIQQGVNDIKPKIPVINQNYELTISKNSAGDVKIFCLADLLK
jgi:hypothetical protein